MMTSIADVASKRRQAIRHTVPLSKAIKAYVIFLYIIPTVQYLHTSKFLEFPKRMLLIFANSTVRPLATCLRQ